MAADVTNADTGNPTIYNGSVVVNPGVMEGDYFCYYRDRAVTKPTISEIETKWESDFPEEYPPTT